MWFDDRVLRSYPLDFGNAFDRRDWRNVPGPLYTSHAFGEFPRASFAILEHRTFCWRQPRDERELTAVLAALSQYRYRGSSFGIDGDLRWTLDGIRAWWAGRDTIARVYRAAGIEQLAAYFEHELPTYLRAYAFALEHGRRPRDGDTLPDIAAPPQVTIGPPRGTFANAIELYLRADALVLTRVQNGTLPMWGHSRAQHPSNVPGVFSLAQSDRPRPTLAPANICEPGFVYRQPRDPDELERVLAAAAREPRFGATVNTATTASAIRLWWRTEGAAVRARMIEAGLDDVEAYVADELPTYLRSLLFAIANGRAPDAGEDLPLLEDITPDRYWRTPRRDQLPYAAIDFDRSAFSTNTFARRHASNVPGPFYAADSDTCGTGPLGAPSNVGCDAEYGQEFVYRQPRDQRELLEIGSAARMECFQGHACDGNAHWTPALVRAWWAARDTHRAAWQAAQVHEVDDMFERELPRYLAGYLFFLATKRAPTPADALPPLETSC